MRTIFIISLLMISSIQSLFAQGVSVKHRQNSDITYILKKEKNSSDLSNMAEIINYIDNNYHNLYGRLKKGEKITVFFDPAHGKDSTERWRGHTTNRAGVTGKPEEYYSIIFSRRMYNLLKANRHINVVTCDEFQKVLDGKSDSYHYLRFKTTVSLAQKFNAFMIIAEHMNNVSIFNKADGMVNIPGLHIVRDNKNRKILTQIFGSYSGYLTLYNKYDASGFSKNYALNIKDGLGKKGYKMNSWEYGAVGDDRFTYYVDFPVSVIYENGFISHPEEEAMLRNPYYIDGIIRTQYDSLLRTLKDVYGVDISGDEVKKTDIDPYKRIELLKLSRLAIYYIESGKARESARVIGIMKKRYSSVPKLRDMVNFYVSIQSKINYSENRYNRGLKLQKKRKYSKARRYFAAALSNLTRNALYYAFKDKYRYAISGRKYTNTPANKISIRPDRIFSDRKTDIEEVVHVDPSPITKPAIIAIEDNNFSDAVTRTFSPDEASLGKILHSMNNYNVSSFEKKKQWSKKRKRFIYRSVRINKKFNFRSGIYIVKFNRDLSIASAKRVPSVYLDDKRYQNQQFLKNSYFGQYKKERSL